MKLPQTGERLRKIAEERLRELAPPPEPPELDIRKRGQFRSTAKLEWQAGVERLEGQPGPLIERVGDRGLGQIAVSAILRTALTAILAIAVLVGTVLLLTGIGPVPLGW
jgi:hypothetical protein